MTDTDNTNDTPTTTVVRFGRLDDDWFWLRFAYDARVIELIKTIPWQDREWWPNDKVCTVDDKHAVALAADLVVLGYPVIGINPLTPDALMVASPDCHHELIFRMKTPT
jgi:hypothetical protein